MTVAELVEALVDLCSPNAEVLLLDVEPSLIPKTVKRIEYESNRSAEYPDGTVWLVVDEVP